MHQRIERVETLADIVRDEVDQRTVQLGPVERHGDGTAVRIERRGRVFLNSHFIYFNARRVLGVEQGIEVAAGHVRLRMRGAEAQFGLGTHARAEKGNIVVVGIETLDMVRQPNSMALRTSVVLTSCKRVMVVSC